MTREEIIGQLECLKEDAIMHFNDDGDDGFCNYGEWKGWSNND